MSLEGKIWITCTGAPWRDLLREFGNWITLHRRFRRWAQSGIFQRIFDVIEEDLDVKAVMVDGNFAKGPPARRRRKKSGCPPDESAARQAIGRSLGGLTTKLMAVVGKAGRLVRFTIRPGNAAEVPELTILLDGVLAGELIADKACDSDLIRLALAAGGIVATIPSRVNRRVQYWYDPIRYRTRHLVENYLCDVKQFRAVSTRYSKLADSHCAMVKMASWIIETRSTRRTAKAPVYKPSDKSPAYNTQLALPLAPAA